MVELRIGERVTVNERAFEVTGFTAASVRPRRVFLRDVETGEEVAADPGDLTSGSASELASDDKC